MTTSNKLIESKRKYLLLSYVGTSENRIGQIICKIKSKYWSWRLERMSEGEILSRYYSLTNRKDEMDLCQRN